MAAAFILVFSVPGHGAVAEPLTTAGIGLANCAKLSKDMSPSEGLNNPTNALMYYWVQGYMSAANITTLESDSEYIDLSKYNETVILPMVHEYCTKNPDKKPISAIDKLLDDTEKLKGPWVRGTIPWAAE